MSVYDKNGKLLEKRKPKLSFEVAEQIREMLTSGYSSKVLQKSLGVTRSTIHRIKYSEMYAKPREE